MSLHFKRFGAPLNQFLDELATELGHFHDKDHAFHVLRTLFMVLRRHLGIGESFSLMELMPVFLRAVYVDGWHVHEGEKGLDTIDGFESEMLICYGAAAGRDFLPRDRIIIAVKDTFRVLARHMGEYEKGEMYNELPQSLRPLWEETVLV